MDTHELKQKMMKLWSDVFHDSDAYISLVFENYFNPDFIEYYEENGKVISALLGVPYKFGNGTEKFNGVYLCGLATVEGYRNRGIMNQLIKKINDRVASKGYVVSFLIPSSDMLRLYYSPKGYYNAMYVVEDRYTNIHNFDNDYQSILNNEDIRIKNLKAKYYNNLVVDKIDISDEKSLDNIINYIVSAEESITSYVTLLHSPKDVKAMIKENLISGGEILVCHTEENKITGVAFITINDHKRVIIPKIYYCDNCSYFRMLNKAKQVYSDLSMGVICYPEETDRRAIWSKVYGATNPDGGMLGGSYGVAECVYEVNRHARPYGMLKILNYREILKFIASSRKDCKFSILIKDAEKTGFSLICTVNNGTATFEEVSNDKTKDIITNDPTITTLNTNDFSDILLRKKDSNNLIMEALGIPRLAINMSLLLD